MVRDLVPTSAVVNQKDLLLDRVVVDGLQTVIEDHRRNQAPEEPPKPATTVSD